MNAASRPNSTKRILGTSVQGRAIECEELGSGDEAVLIMGAIHGEEPASAALVTHLAEKLRNDLPIPQDRRLVLMPVANPDGYAAGVRQNAHGTDLNRNFPAPNFARAAEHGAAPLCEPESRVIKSVVDDYRPVHIVAVHQPKECIDFDGPAKGLAEAMAACTNLPIKRLGSLPGSLGSYAGLQLNIPIITLELPEEASDQGNEALWNAYGKAMLAAVHFPNPIPD